MDKITFDINCELMRKLGINPEEGVNYLLNKKAVAINPVHVKALHVLKQKPAVASS